MRLSDLENGDLFVMARDLKDGRRIFLYFLSVASIFSSSRITCNLAAGRLEGLPARLPVFKAIKDTPFEKVPRNFHFLQPDPEADPVDGPFILHKKIYNEPKLYRSSTCNAWNRTDIKPDTIELSSAVILLKL